MACFSQDNADQQGHSGVHCTGQCAEALMQESRLAEAGTQGLEAKLASASVKGKSESQQLAENENANQAETAIEELKEHPRWVMLQTRPVSLSLN